MSRLGPEAPAIGLRPRVAGRAAVLVGSVSRRLGRGSGSVIGGRVGLLLEPDLVRLLGHGRTIALVSGTNGKTTTTRLFAAAMGGPALVATSAAGANLPSGLATALAASAPGTPAVLEVDEGYLARVVADLAPAVVALLNLSRDQLDRVSEVRMVAARWRAGLAGREATAVVANADDPLVAWAAGDAPRVVWVAAGELWHSDAVGCPACGGRVIFRDGGDWSCTCGFRRPPVDAWLDDGGLVLRDGRRFALHLSIPGRFNLANAAIAALGASQLGVQLTDALAAMASVSDVEGRFATVALDGQRRVRLLLAKNPAGWTELLGLLGERRDPVVIGINARIADGHDPSWLWDVPFERLAGRFVTATGERCLDLAVRLRHARVEHAVVPDQYAALHAAGEGQVDYVGNYTAFQQLRRSLAGAGRSRADGRRPRTSPTSPVESPVESRGDRSGAPAPVPSPVAPGTTPRRRTDGVSALRVVVVHPDLLGTYGDSGNGRVLANRARWRGIDAELVMALSDEPLPAAGDLYCLGGGEDGPQVRSAEVLADGTLERAVQAGAAVLAVCAGFQVVGTSFPDAEGTARRGAGLLDVATVKGTQRRAVGEVLVDPDDFPPPATDTGGIGAQVSAQCRRLPRLTGFENHAGVTRLGPGVRALGRVAGGVGNGGGDGTEGAVAGRVVGTYLHGPVLARNPSLADLLLGLVLEGPLTPLDDREEEALRAERLRSQRGAGRQRPGRRPARAGRARAPR